MRAPILVLLLLLAPSLVAASPHDAPAPTEPATAFAASWDNSAREATDGETAPFVAQHMAENVQRNARGGGRNGGEGLAIWPWGADHPDHQDAPGLVLPVAFMSAAGWRIEADVWLPPDVRLVDGRLEGDAPRAGLVLTPGFSAGRDMYAWLLARLAADGYVVLAWDPQGQGTSHGPAATAQDYENDLKRAIDWFHSEHLNPAHHLFDGRFGLVGHSQGGNAAYWLGGEPEYADRVRGLVALSSSWLNETVPFPVQTWTGDYDGGFAQPAYLGLNYGATDYEDLKPKYDAHLAGEKQLLVLAGATHDSWTNIPFVYGDGRTHELTWRYAKPFLDRHVRGDASRGTYDAIVTPVDGVSRAYPSEYRFAVAQADMTRPVAPSLGQDAAPFAARAAGADREGACRIEGVARDEAGAPVAGAIVRLEGGASLTTDAAGGFAFHGVARQALALLEHPYAPALAAAAEVSCADDPA